MRPEQLRSAPDPHSGADTAGGMPKSGEPNRLAGLPLFACVPDPVAASDNPTAATGPTTGPRLTTVRPGQAPDCLAHPPAAADRLVHDRSASRLGRGYLLQPAQLGPAATSAIDQAERATPPPAMDWAQVRAFRQLAAELLTTQLQDRSGLDEEARREIGRGLIVAMLRDHADTLLAKGGQPPTPA